MTSHSDVLQFKSSGSWLELARVAVEMVTDAEQRAGVAMHPKLGGGTRLMLAFSHRISDDINLFIRDPQWIGYLTPRLNDRFESVTSGYEESASALKLRLPAGEIDFIVSMSLLGLPDDRAADVPFALEAVDEVLAKKLFYRGWALTPRNLFDWRAVVREALLSMKTSRSAAAAWEAIRAPDKPALDESIEWALCETEGYAHPPSASVRRAGYYAQTATARAGARGSHRCSAASSRPYSGRMPSAAMMSLTA